MFLSNVDLVFVKDVTVQGIDAYRFTVDQNVGWTILGFFSVLQIQFDVKSAELRLLQVL